MLEGYRAPTQEEEGNKLNAKSLVLIVRSIKLQD